MQVGCSSGVRRIVATKAAWDPGDRNGRPGCADRTHTCYAAGKFSTEGGVAGAEPPEASNRYAWTQPNTLMTATTM